MGLCVEVCCGSRHCGGFSGYPGFGSEREDGDEDDGDVLSCVSLKMFSLCHFI